MQGTRTMILTARQSLTPTVVQLRLRTQDGLSFPFAPGQFISVSVPDASGALVSRKYSLANVSGELGEIELVFTLVAGGIASEHFISADIGSLFEVSGPFGHLTFPETPPRRLLLVASGTGVAPYRSMLPQIRTHLQKVQNSEVLVILGTKSREEQLYTDEFLALSQTEKGFHYLQCLSQEKCDCSESGVFKGRVQVALLSVTPDPNTDLVYLCGNPAMVDDVFSQLQEWGFSSTQVKREKYLYAPKSKAVLSSLTEVDD